MTEGSDTSRIKSLWGEWWALHVSGKYPDPVPNLDPSSHHFIPLHHNKSSSSSSPSPSSSSHFLLYLWGHIWQCSELFLDLLSGITPDVLREPYGMPAINKFYLLKKKSMPWLGGICSIVQHKLTINEALGLIPRVT